MLDQYLIVHKTVLPEYFQKVLEAKRLLDSGSVRDVSKAAKAAGISRSTYYKYRDYVYEPSQLSEGRHAVLSMVLNHEPGVLSGLLSRISIMGASVLTITQSIPVQKKASVTLSLEVGSMSGTLNQLTEALESAVGVEQVRLVGVE